MIQTNYDQFKKYLTLSWCFFVGYTFCFPRIMLLKSTGCTNSAWVFLSTFCPRILFNIPRCKSVCHFGKVYETFSLLRTGYIKSSFQKRVTFWSGWFSPTSPLESMEYVLSIPLCLRLQTEPNETKFPAMTFSSTHWKNTLDLWTNERRLHHGYLKITWLACVFAVICWEVSFPPQKI